ncbi:MAG: hypothetical protein WDN45_01830 [Caulobacteraceae bacterium]
MPEFITCLHEETAVDMATGYAKATGKPDRGPCCTATLGPAARLHGHLPSLLRRRADDHPDRPATRASSRAHTADDMASMTRGLHQVGTPSPRPCPRRSTPLQEAYRQATTAPTGPVVVIVDTEIQKGSGRFAAGPRLPAGGEQGHRPGHGGQAGRAPARGQDPAPGGWAICAPPRA